VTERVPTRQLIILRHAKAAWPDVEDRLRPLADRGRRDAPAAGRWLRQAEQRLDGFRIDRIVCSPARRTRETWELAAAELDDPPAPIYDGRVYAATTATLLAVVREFTGEPLDRVREKYPTSGIALFNVEVEWSALLPGRAQLTEFAVPRGSA
jgi:phosphohistidine phosphatase